MLRIGKKQKPSRTEWTSQVPNMGSKKLQNTEEISSIHNAYTTTSVRICEQESRQGHMKNMLPSSQAAHWYFCPFSVPI